MKFPKNFSKPLNSTTYFSEFKVKNIAINTTALLFTCQTGIAASQDLTSRDQFNIDCLATIYVVSSSIGETQETIEAKSYYKTWLAPLNKTIVQPAFKTSLQRQMKSINPNNEESLSKLKGVLKACLNQAGIYQ